MRRQVKAMAVVLAILCVVPGVDVLVSFAHGWDESSPAPAVLEVHQALAEPDAFNALERIDRQLSENADELPEALEDSVVILPGSTDMRVDDAGRIIGYTVSGADEDVLASIKGQMESGGWTAVPLGGVCGATFVRSEGACKWAMVVCAQVGDVTSVVTSCVVS